MPPSSRPSSAPTSNAGMQMNYSILLSCVMPYLLEVPLALANISATARHTAERHAFGYRWGGVLCQREDVPSSSYGSVLRVELASEDELRSLAWWLERRTEAASFFGNKDLRAQLHVLNGKETQAVLAAAAVVVPHIDGLLTGPPVTVEDFTAGSSLFWSHFQHLRRLELINAQTTWRRIRKTDASGQRPMVEAAEPSAPIPDGGALRGLEELPCLEELNLQRCTVESIGFMGQSRSLRVLDLSWSSLTSRGLAGLGESESLEELRLVQCAGVTTIHYIVPPTPRRSPSPQAATSALEGAREPSQPSFYGAPTHAGALALRLLDLRSTNVDNDGIAGIERLPALETLFLGRTKVKSVALLKDARSLKHLDLEYGTSLEQEGWEPHDPGFSEALQNPSIESWNLSHTSLLGMLLSKGGCLTGLTRLITSHTTTGAHTQDVFRSVRHPLSLEFVTHLNMSYSTFTEVEELYLVRELSHCTHVKYLDLTRTSLRHFHEALCNMQHLTEVRLAHTVIADINLLAELPCVTVVDASYTSLQDEGICRLGEAPCLEVLSLEGTSVSTVGHLGRCQTLRKLLLARSLVTSAGLHGLEESPLLEELQLRETLIKYFTAWDTSQSRYCPLPASVLKEVASPLNSAAMSERPSLVNGRRVPSTSLPAPPPPDPLTTADGGHTVFHTSMEFDEASITRLWEHVAEVAQACWRDGLPSPRSRQSQPTTAAVTEDVCRWLPEVTPQSGQVFYPSLRVLGLSNTRHRATGLLGILQMPKLEELDLTDTWMDGPIGSLFAYAAAAHHPSSDGELPLHRRLQVLLLKDVQLMRPQFLRGMEFSTALSRLSLQGSQSSLHSVAGGSLACTATCPTLKHVDFSLTDVDSNDMAAFAVSPSWCKVSPSRTPTPAQCWLQRVNLSNTDVIEIDFLAHHSCLQVLLLHNTKVSSIQSLETCTRLLTLDISKTCVRDLVPLTLGCRHLRVLNLADSLVTQDSVEVLARLRSLEELDLSGTPITSLDILQGRLPRLRQLQTRRTTLAKQLTKGLTIGVTSSTA